MRRFWIGSCFLLFLLHSSASASIRGIAPKVMQTSVSKRRLLESCRFQWDQGRFQWKSRESSSGPDTVRILAMRAEFQVDEDEGTTGDGRFDLSEPESPVIDPSPHDRTYFEHQLDALANYYQTISKGMLILEADVLPDVLTLPREMAGYNPATTEAAVDSGMVMLFRDAVRLADASEAKFSNYDSYFVFHAGVGRDIDLGFDLTPNDIPSAFLSLDDLRQILAGGDTEYEGIAVEGSSFFVPEGLVLPETESQEGYEIGLLGTMALMFGFQLGLPALWDTRTGSSGIGRWGLMDQGSGNYSGLIPAEPCAWTKIFMGWEDPVEVTAGNALEVACSASQSADRIYKIPITREEYFLVENRQYDPNGDGLTHGWDHQGNRITFRADGQIEVSEAVGVIVRVEAYDFGLPGSGILIWHIDERVIAEKIADNAVNSDRVHRGVDLEEADGAQDIGESYGFLSGGSGSETGVLHDAWYADNEIHMLTNGSDEVRLTPESYPSSRSNSGANSHVVIDAFSEIDTVMTFSVRNDMMMRNFPVDFGMGHTPFPPLYGDLDGDGNTEIVVGTVGGKIFAWQRDGIPAVPSDAMGFRVSPGGDTITFPVAQLADFGEDVGVVVMTDFEGTQRSDIVVGTTSGRVVRLYRDDEQFMQGLYWEGDEAVSAITNDVILNIDGFVVGTESGAVVGIRSDDIFWEKDFGPGGISGICSYRENDFIVTTDEGLIGALDHMGRDLWKTDLSLGESIRSPASAWSGIAFDPPFLTVTGDGGGVVLNRLGVAEVTFGGRIISKPISDPALGDIDDDGFIEIAVSAGGQVWCFNHNGSLVDGYPVPWQDRNILLSSPVLGDVDGDGSVDVVVTTSDGDVEAYDPGGARAGGFPLRVGGQFPIAPTLLDLDGDGKTELAVVNQNGSLIVWNLDAEYGIDTVPWGSWLYDPTHKGRIIQSLAQPQAGEDWMPADLVYNYPNPTEGDYTTIRYRLETSAAVWIRVFDLSGELVDEFPGPGVGLTENEVIWDLTDVSSGTYLCLVTAESSQHIKTVSFKIAVVK